MFFFFKQKTAYEMRISDWSSDVCSSDLTPACDRAGRDMTNHLYLVDGSGYIFRAYHRLPPLTNIRGEPVGAVYGYTTMLWKLVDELHKADGPTHMAVRSEEHTSELQSLMRISYAVFCLKKKKMNHIANTTTIQGT